MVEKLLQFVSLDLSSVCLSWSSVMSDSQAVWHCRTKEMQPFLSSYHSRLVCKMNASVRLTTSFVLHR